MEQDSKRLEASTIKEQNKCEMCDGSGVAVEMVPEIVCCGCPTEYGSCCGNGKIEYFPQQVQCECEQTTNTKPINSKP